MLAIGFKGGAAMAGDGRAGMIGTMLAGVVLRLSRSPLSAMGG
jgi:hypothetical protein